MIFKDGGYIMTKKALLDHEKFNNSIKKSRIKQELLAERLDISVRHYTLYPNIPCFIFVDGLFGCIIKR